MKKQAMKCHGDFQKMLQTAWKFCFAPFILFNNGECYHIPLRTEERPYTVYEYLVLEIFKHLFIKELPMKVH